ncbi:probable RNA polymerase II nuclear localization protein SLC7A6OS [Melitaea cinxia]|uniref:probable RNA polymerase II nuclear localization protein SLC7A6OS n=1 Tax=Melitaea cinxia TaxID=113334 RepID=UPI001E273720|nr:probable RNA polymerase II nuclear localization protein SLC7A6OS [Melitaea cinxia]
MATSTFLRVKRRLEDNPQDAFVLLCKRMKTDTEEISPSLFVFRGTVESQEPTHVKRLAPNSFKLKTFTNVNDIISKMRKERKDFATESRYKVVNCSRGVKIVTEKNDNYDIVDLQMTDLQKKEEEQENEQYIYDLYTSAKEDFDISMLDNLVSIENYETELIYGSARDNGLMESDVEDSDDSNAENYFKNDYPDSDPSSIDEDDMVEAVKNCNIEDDLSSDIDEDMIYDEPAEFFNEDVKRYGIAYAKYKARVLSEQPDLANGNNYVFSTRIDDTQEYNSDEGFYYGQEQDSEQFREQYADDSSDPD